MHEIKQGVPYYLIIQLQFVEIIDAELFSSGTVRFHLATRGFTWHNKCEPRQSANSFMLEQKAHAIGTSYTMGCPPVRGDNPRALASHEL